MRGMGVRLRKVRLDWGLSLREVEAKSFQFAQQSGNPAFQISASWLTRLEREEHDLTAAKLIALASIYKLSYEEVLGYTRTGDEYASPLSGKAGPKATLSLDSGLFEEEARSILPDTFTSDQPPEETALLPSASGTLPSLYRRVILGSRDRSLDPMIRAGSILQVHTQKRQIAPPREWTYETDRPIYVLLTHDGYLSGWCELDKESTWLTLIPHPLSHASSQRWRYRKEVEVIGQVVAVCMRLLSQP